MNSRYTTLERLTYGSDELSLLDTSLADFHLYNLAFKNNFGVMNLGNSLTAIYPVKFESPKQRGFQLGWNYLDPYLFKANNQSKYFNTLKPLTNLFYIQGATELLHLEVNHSQNILPNWNMGLEYRRHKEDGFYLRQQNGTYNTRLYNWFHTKDYKYHVLADVVWNRIDNQESGGILSRESFDTLDGPVRQPEVRYFGTGEQEARNIVRTNTYSLTQIYRFGESKKFPTEALDTLGRPILDTIATFIPKSQIRLKAEYGWLRNLFVINDLDGFGFQNFYLDSTATYDSLSYQHFNATLAFESGQFREIDDSFFVAPKSLAYSVELAYEGIKVGWLKDFAQYNNVLLSARLGSNPYPKSSYLNWNISAYSALSGFNSGDYDLDVWVSKKVKEIELKADAGSKAYSPSFNQTYYFGNHDFWKLPNLRKQNSQTASLGFDWRKNLLQVKAAYTLLDNFIYMGTQPIQLGESIAISQVSVKTHLRYKVLNWQAEMIWQPNRQDELPLPEFTSRQSLYAQGPMFKGALIAKLGIDFCYSTEFRAPVYDAPTRFWRVQQAGENFTIGNYPYLNIYFTGKIQTVTFFFMMQHVNNGLFGKNYYSSPYYPMAPRAFRFGIKWTLFE